MTQLNRRSQIYDKDPSKTIVILAEPNKDDAGFDRGVTYLTITAHGRTRWRPEKHLATRFSQREAAIHLRDQRNAKRPLKNLRTEDLSKTQAAE